MSENQKGEQITKAFLYVQQVCKECQRLIFKIDSQMEPEWINLYGNRITRDVSSSLQDPDRWIIEAIFRAYESNNGSRVNKVITITFLGDELNEPLITAGKIVYSDISKRNHWDLWNIWFSEDSVNSEPTYKADGTLYQYHSPDLSYIEEAQVFSRPLISITDDEVLMEKIIKPLKDL